MLKMSVLIFILSFLISVIHADLGFSDIKIYFIEDRPIYDKSIKSQHELVNLLSLRLVRGESEGTILMINTKEKRLMVNYDPDVANDTFLDIFKIEFINILGIGKLGDPLIPIKPKSILNNENGKIFLYVRMTAGRKSKAGKGGFSLNIKTDNEQRDIKINYEVLPFIIEPEYFPMVQATVRPMFRSYPVKLSTEGKLKIMKNLTKLLSESYNVKSFAIL